LPTVLEHQAVARADRPFLCWTDAAAPHTFAQVNTIANRLAHGLARIGLARHDSVALLLPNCLEFVFAWFAAQKLGAIEVPISDAYKGPLLEHALRISRAKILITTSEAAERVAEIERALPALHRCYILDPPGTKPGSPRFERVVVAPFEELYTQREDNPGLEVTPRDPAAVLFTSGTTGPSKGVLMPHSQFYFFAEEGVQLLRLTDQDVHMTGFPLIHGNAQFLTVYPCLIAAARCVLYPRFSASDFIARAHRSGATVTNLLGSTMAFICAQPPSLSDRDHKLERIYAAPLSSDLAPVFTERFGVSDFVNGFGQTEISLPFMTPPGEAAPPGACGVLVDQWFEVRLCDPDTGEEVPTGTAGELLVRPKAPGIISAEYFGMPEKTVEAWRDLWFHTGDALKRDAEGWYYFVDRVKDALRRRGENISSFEVEAVIREHPAVADCAVVAVKADESGGEDEVKACIVTRAGAAVGYEELIAWCDRRMAAFMVPRYLEILEDLPRTPSEKVRKNALRAAGVTPGTWDRVKAGCRLESEFNKKQHAAAR
jgi:crotonobetaine/carnitine-CoA ligase